jgi:hypothetical protein
MPIGQFWTCPKKRVKRCPSDTLWTIVQNVKGYEEIEIKLNFRIAYAATWKLRRAALHIHCDPRY